MVARVAAVDIFLSAGSRKRLHPYIDPSRYRIGRELKWKLRL
jgi:hypothetical protein